LRKSTLSRYINRASYLIAMDGLAHLLSFYSSPEPRIVFRKDDETLDLVLQGCLSIRFSVSRHCIGYSDDEGWKSCPERNRGYQQCYACRKRDISHVYTCLDFTGYEDIEQEYVRQDFSIYLAQFGNEIIKCGVTRSERVAQRTMEQGADHWIELMRFDDARQAYAAEMRLQRDFNLCNAVRNSTKLALLGQSADPTSLESIAKEIIQKAEKDPLVSKLLVRDARIVSHSFHVPRSPKIAYRIDGKIMGSKSKLLFFGSKGQDFVVDMSKNTGRLFRMESRG